jgi:uncharacterized protein (UPF0297 family)
VIKDDDLKKAEQAAIKRARIGMDAEQFVHSDIYKEINKREADREADLVTQLIDADPDDIKLGRDLRNQLTVIERFREYLQELVNTGLAAEQQLEGIDSMQGEHQD